MSSWLRLYFHSESMEIDANDYYIIFRTEGQRAYIPRGRDGQRPSVWIHGPNIKFVVDGREYVIITGFETENHANEFWLEKIYYPYVN